MSQVIAQLGPIKMQNRDGTTAIHGAGQMGVVVRNGVISHEPHRAGFILVRLNHPRGVMKIGVGTGRVEKITRLTLNIGSRVLEAIVDSAGDSKRITGSPDHSTG